MILLVLLCIVLFLKYNLKEPFFLCHWDWKYDRAVEERDKHKADFLALERTMSINLESVKQKQDEINVKNSLLEEAILSSLEKYNVAYEEENELTQQLNKATIDLNNCKNFNSLKLNAIKKIYS